MAAKRDARRKKVHNPSTPTMCHRPRRPVNDELPLSPAATPKSSQIMHRRRSVLCPSPPHPSTAECAGACRLIVGGLDSRDRQWASSFTGHWQAW